MSPFASRVTWGLAERCDRGLRELVCANSLVECTIRMLRKRQFLPTLNLIGPKTLIPYSRQCATRRAGVACGEAFGTAISGVSIPVFYRSGLS